MKEIWVKIHNKFLYWEWFKKPEMVQLWMYLLLNANWHDTTYQGIDVKRGQVFTSRKQIKDGTGLSEQTIRTCLNRLERTGEIKREVVKKSTDQGSVITICNYDTYQVNVNSSQPTSNQPLTNRQPTVNQPLTNNITEYRIIDNNNIKEESNKEEKNAPPIGCASPETKEVVNQPKAPKKTKEQILAELKIREQDFYNSLIPFVQIYGKQMIRAFFNYWSEPNKSKTKMNFELERTWDLERRLRMWASRETKYQNNNGNTTKEERRTDAVSVIEQLIEKERNSITDNQSNQG